MGAIDGWLVDEELGPVALQNITNGGTTAVKILTWLDALGNREIGLAELEMVVVICASIPLVDITHRGLNPASLATVTRVNGERV